MAPLFWMTALTLLLCGHHCMVSERKKEFELCVTSRQRIKDLSYQNLSSIPSNLPKDTEYLDVSHNNIARLDGACLAGLTHLCFLTAAFCDLRVITTNAFDHTPNIIVLNISHNFLSVIPDLSLPQLKILDLSSNLYGSYQLPSTFQSLTHLDFLVLRSHNAISVTINDFAPLRDIPLKHFSLGTGNTTWQRYEAGSLAKLKSLEEFTLTVPFCEKFEIFNSILTDLNETATARIRLVKLFHQKCTVTGDPFENIKSMSIKNLTIIDTWINSSVMVKLFKNVCLSPLQQLAFVNITYNEDTPDGFQFPSMNHTINIQSVIFDGVRHYQIKYPKINISVDIFSKMTYLKFSGSGMNISPCDLMSALPSLETLDLSDNILQDLGFWWPTCSYTSVFPKLRHLSLSHNRFHNLAFVCRKIHQMKALQSLDLSSNAISIHVDQRCSWPSHLTDLSLGQNNLGNNVFQHLSPHFERIDLSKTGITAITQEILSEFPRLKHLILTSNSIQVIPDDLHAPKLLSLHLDVNAITSISRETLEGLPKLRTFKAGNNPFSCTCDAYWFVTSLNKTLLPDWPLDYECNVPPSLVGLPLAQYKIGKITCEPWLQAAIAVPVMAVIVAVLGLTFYACDGVWYTQMLWVWIRVKRRSKQTSDRLRDVSFRYHGFISYSQHDSSWVDSQLVPSLEGAGLSLCVHERDFVPGKWIIGNIIDCVEASYKTLFVLSNHFVQSEWCNYELFFAQHREISMQEDSLVFILLEPIPTDSLPKRFLTLRTLLKQQTYLEWPDDERKRQLFWSSLKLMLRAADESVILREAAESIADTLPLLTDQS